MRKMTAVPGNPASRPARSVAGLVISVALLATTVAACGKSDTSPRHEQPQDAAMAYYAKLVAGDYAGFVAGMESCDSVPEFYREQMVTLIKQHYREEAAANGGLARVEVARTVVVQDTVAANVFLDVTYGDSTTEEIVQPMVWDGRSWRLQ